MPGGRTAFPQRHPLPALFVAVFASGFGFGIVLPLSSVILEARQTPTPLIGLTATAMFVGMALGAPLSGRAIELYGIRRTLTAGLCAAGCLLTALGLWVALPAWLLLRLLMGMAFASVFTSSETLINRLSTDQTRGRNLGLYAFAFSLSLMIGPVGLWLLDFGIWLPFLAAGAFCAGAGVLAAAAIPPVREEPCAVRLDVSFLRRILLSVITMLMAGFMEGALIALIPVYALRTGFDAGQTGLLLFAFMLGHGGLPPVVGIIGDRVGLRRVLAFVYGLGSLSCLAVLACPGDMRLAILLALAGSSVGVLYPLAVGLLPGALSSAELPRGNAITTFCYGLGSIAGPFVPSLIMHVSVPQSLFAVAAALYITVLLWMLRRPKQAVKA